MKPKQIGVDKMSAYDIEPRTGKPFNSIKVQGNGQNGQQPRGSMNMSLDTQVPYTNWKKEFTQQPQEIDEIGRFLGTVNNLNVIEEYNNNVGRQGQAENSDKGYVKQQLKK